MLNCEHIANPNARDPKKRGRCKNPAAWRFHVRGIAEALYDLCDEHAKPHMKALKQGTLEWSATPINRAMSCPSCSSLSINARLVPTTPNATGTCTDLWHDQEAPCTRSK